MFIKGRVVLTVLSVIFMTVLFTVPVFAQSVTLAVEPVDECAEGDPMVFTATAEGFSDPEYKFVYRKVGVTTIFDGQRGDDNVWETEAPEAGVYDFAVQVREKGTFGWPGVGDDGFDWIQGYVINAPDAPSVTLTIEPAGTAHEGQQVTFTATSEKVDNPEYRFVYRLAGKTKLYFPQTGTSNVWTETAPAGSANTYDFGVQVREAGTIGWSSPPIHNIVFDYVITEEPVEEELEVLSVEAVSRTSIVADLATDVDPLKAADKDSYDVTVGGDDLAVEDVDYDAATDVATLTVDMDGMSGELIVNGTSAAVDVPPVPVFESIDTKAGSSKIELNFNTEVYNLGAIDATDFTVVIDGNTRTPASADDIDIPDDKDDAATSFSITASGLAIGGSQTEVTLTTDAAEQIGNIFDENPAPATIFEITPEDEDAPEFTGVRAVEGGYVLYMDFSEAIHTDGEDLCVDPAGDNLIRIIIDGTAREIIGAYADDEDVLTGTNINIASGKAAETLKLVLNIDDYDSLIGSGDFISVTIDSDLLDDDSAPYIQDLSGNVLEGDRVQVGEVVTGPMLTDAAVSDFTTSADTEQTFSFTLDGNLAGNDQVWIDVSEVEADLLVLYATAYTGNNVEVNHADMDIIYNGVDDRFEITATDDIAGGTVVVVTVENMDTIALAAATDQEVTFQRRDYGTTAVDTFDINDGS